MGLAFGEALGGACGEALELPERSRRPSAATATTALSLESKDAVSLSLARATIFWRAPRRPSSRAVWRCALRRFDCDGRCSWGALLVEGGGLLPEGAEKLASSC